VRAFDVELALATADPAGDPTIVPGLDLDCRVSDEDDVESCFHADFVSPNGQPGIDNQLGPILHSVATGLATRARVEIYATDPGADERCTGVRIVDASGALLAESTSAEGTRDEIHARFDDLSLPLSLVVPAVAEVAALLLVELGRVHLSLDLAGGSLEGTLAGEVEIEQVITAFVAAYPSVAESLVRNIAEGQADLRPDERGYCTFISTGFTVSAP
jgi:hypothetical protein